MKNIFCFVFFLLNDHQHGCQQDHSSDAADTQVEQGVALPCCGLIFASFCLLDDFGEYEGVKIGAPGCVGTVTEYRRQGIGLRMIQLATAWFKEHGYDLSYIHYTYVGHWYARLGYKTVVKWNCNGMESKMLFRKCGLSAASPR